MTTQYQIYSNAASSCGMLRDSCVIVGRGIAAVIIDRLSRGGVVNAAPLGRFYVKEWPPRTIRDPNTGLPIKLPARKTPWMIKPEAWRQIADDGSLTLGGIRGPGQALLPLLQELAEIDPATVPNVDMQRLCLIVQKIGPRGAIRIWHAVAAELVRAAFLTGRAELQPLGVIVYRGVRQKSVVINPNLSRDRKIIDFRKFNFRPTREFKTAVK